MFLYVSLSLTVSIFSLRFSISELSPSDSYTPTLHLIAYSVNQKGRSEPTILEDIAINEAEKRTGRCATYIAGYFHETHYYTRFFLKHLLTFNEKV